MAGRRFEAQETTTYRALQNTMQKLGATSLRVSPRDLMNQRDNLAEIVFDRGGRRYVVRCRKWPNWLDNLRAAERVIYYLHRAVQEYGVTTSEKGLAEAVAQLLTAFEVAPDDKLLMLTDGRADWWVVLGLERTATKADVMNAYRALARVHHPDSGGDAEMFKRIRRAYEEATGP